MSHSLYEIDGYQDIAKPSDYFGENWYLQDVFNQTRPDMMNYDDNHTDNQDHKRHPWFKERDKDEKEDKGDHEISDHKYLFSPQNWDQQESQFGDTRRYTGNINQARRVVSLFLLEESPKNMTFYAVDKSRTAASMADLMRYTSRFSRKRSPRTNVNLIRKPKDNNLTWMYRVRGYEKWSDKKGHVVTVKLEKDNKEKDIRKMQVRVSCTCPFWKYYGPDYNANRNEYLYGESKSNGQSPDKNDPKRQNIICKHVYSVGLIFQRFATKYNLDNYKELDDILDLLGEEKDQFLPEITSEGVKSIIQSLDTSEKRKLEPILNRFEKEKNETRRERIWSDLMKEMKETLEVKDKSFLKKLYDKFRSFFKNKKRSSVRKASLSNILEIYKEENGERYGDL